MLKNIKHANTKMITAFGELKFDSEGVVVEPKDLSDEAVEALLQLKGFEKVEVSKAEKASAKKVAEKEEQNDTPEEKEVEENESKAKGGIKRPSTRKTAK